MRNIFDLMSGALKRLAQKSDAKSLKKKRRRLEAVERELSILDKAYIKSSASLNVERNSLLTGIQKIEDYSKACEAIASASKASVYTDKEGNSDD